MKCPKCQHENPDTKKFCGECGAKLEKVCPNCSESNPPQYKFCGECGHNLTVTSEPTPKDLSFDEKIDKIQRYLPKGLTKKILSQRNKIEGERKQVAVMFCDMEGFTQLTERLGPEEAYSVMDQVYEILIHKVHDYEGTVNEMTGDGIMALFGAPIALEDAPQRAIRSSLAIHREIAKFSDQLKQQKKDIPAVKMRIGINTGPVVVGTVGNDLRVEFKAVGDTVNLASRMEGLAEPGATYVTEDTFKLTEGFFRFEALGQKQVKGKEEPVNVYCVIAPSTRRTRFDVSAERGLTPFVGRERKLELLLDGFERAKGGRGQAFSIVSEAGVGKSRLLYEFRKAVANEDVTFLEGRCLSYSRGVSYHPVIDILKANFDIREGDGDSEIRGKVKRGLKILGADEVSILPYLLELFSVKESGIEKIPLSPEARKDRIIEAINRITLKGSEIRPLILAYEDLHWVDRSSEDVLKYVLESIPGARVLMIFTYRPEFVHTWGARSYHSQVNLNRLSNRESLIMVSYLLGTEELDKELEEFILEKTEGVPFFIEELIKSFKDLTIIEVADKRYRITKDLRAVTIPATIQDVIMARVDSLPEGTKDLLQTISVVGRESSYDLIKRLTGLTEQELLSHLSGLKDSELIYERGIYPQSTYIFKHALTRDVVYDSILSKRRKKLHGHVGNAIEELYKDNINEHYEVLAEHYIASENYEKAAEYSTLAARVAEMVGSLNDAIAYSEKAVACLEKLPETEEITEKIIDARTALGMYLLRMLFYKEARDAIAPITEKAIKSGYKSIFPKIFTILGTYEFNVREDLDKSFQYFEDAVKIAEELNDKGSLYLASFRLALSYSLNCEFEKGDKYFENAFNIVKTANNLLGMSATKSYQSIFCYQWWGRLKLSEKTALEAIRIAEESGDIYTKAMAYTTLGWTLIEKGMIEEAKKNLLMGIEFCEKINYDIFNAIARYKLAQAYYETGRWQKSMEQYTKAAVFVEHCGGFRSWSEHLRLGAIMAMVKMENSKIDLDNFNKYTEKARLRAWDGWKSRYIGEILLNIDDKHLSEAEEWIKKAIMPDDKNTMMMHLGEDYKVYSDLLKRKGDKLRARENLIKAIEIFRECGADERAKNAEKEL